MTTSLALFTLDDLTPDQPRICGWCKRKPATTRVYATQNLFGVHPAWMTTWYRDATRRAQSSPCCDACAWYVADAWWGGLVCPVGACCLWAHTLADPHPDWNCTRHHRERTVVWRTPLAVPR